MKGLNGNGLAICSLGLGNRGDLSIVLPSTLDDED